MHTPRSFLRGPELAFVLFLALTAVSLRGQVAMYWDINNNGAGAGGATPSGTWSTSGGTNKNWSTNANGGGTVNWTSGNDAFFSASNDATGSYTVTVSGTQNVSSITVDEGSPTLSSGTINFSDATPDIRVASGSTLAFSNAPTSSTNSLTLGSASYTGTTVLAANTTLSGTVTLGGGTLRLSGTSYTIGTLNVTGSSTIDFAGATTLNLTNLTISAGVTLTIQNWTQASDYFFAANWTGAVQDLYDNANTAPMNQVQFQGFGTNQTGWDSYDKQIRPNVPEPSAYGVSLLLALTAFFSGRRLMRRSAC